MNDKELADKVVALGVGSNYSKGEGRRMPEMDGPQTMGPYTDEVFVRDWRVAGALMEKCGQCEVNQLSAPLEPKWTALIDTPRLREG